MAMDTFICGSCHMTFNDIEQFVTHKKDCSVNILPPANNQDTQAGEQEPNMGHVVVSNSPGWFLCNMLLITIIQVPN